MWKEQEMSQKARLRYERAGCLTVTVNLSHSNVYGSWSEHEIRLRIEGIESMMEEASAGAIGIYNAGEVVLHERDVDNTTCT